MRSDACAPPLGWPWAGKQVRTTKPCACTQQPSDLLRHDISVHAPHERGGLDFTYVRVDQIVLGGVRHGHALAHGLGWAVSLSIDTSFAPGALEQAARSTGEQWGAASKGSSSTVTTGRQYVPIRHTGRLVQEGDRGVPRQGRLATRASHAHDVLSKLLRIRLRHDDNHSRTHSRALTSSVTNPCTPMRGPCRSAPGHLCLEDGRATLPCADLVDHSWSPPCA